MRGVFKFVRLGLVAVYALSTLVAVLLGAAHQSPERGVEHSASAALAHALCLGGEETNDASKRAGACCGACQLSDAVGLAAISTASFLMRHEASTRRGFARRLGHVTDDTPDDLRSRAPPALAV
jgi:hypothetical protein